MSSVPNFSLNNGVTMPAIGLGGWGGEELHEREAAREWFLTALQSGYKHVDVAQLYGTEESLGKAVRESGINRKDLFITTKLPLGHHSRVAESFQESLDNLALDYIDLILITRSASEGVAFPKNPDGLEILLKTANVVPAVNQVELHPYLAQSELVEYCRNKGILVTAYTPTGYQNVLTDPVIVDLAGKYGVSAAQIVLAWHVARGIVAVPKSSNKERQKHNINLPTLEAPDVAKITALDKGQRLSVKPDEAGLVFGMTLEQLGWCRSLSHTMTHVPSLTLNNGVKIPAVGLGGGTYHPAERAVAKDWFLTALEAGYRLVDVAQIYGKCTATTGLTHETYLPSLETEEALGQAIKASGIPREELFITTKIPKHSSLILAAGLTKIHILQYLIHWPFPFEYEEGEFYPKHPDGSIKLARSPSFVELWAEIEKLLDTGKVRAIGVCNFSIKNLEILLKSAKVVPAVNQFELHPYLAQTELVEYCKSKGIVVEAYTPTGSSAYDGRRRTHTHSVVVLPGYQKVLADPTINELAVRYSVSAAQVVLAWHLARGCIPIPKSSNKDRQKQNLTASLDIFRVDGSYIDGWVEQLPTLEPSDIIKISALDKGERICAKLDENGTLFGATAEQLGW
ncbi:hypothetical protein EYR40_010049 [Pleurotus pulmonarius]|nr:hypothetical protein EYR40_010049 [Pleurotus pulmonarius]